MVSDDPITTNSFSSDLPVNPAIPDSTGALLAEEWTVNPRSTLPSFLERVMMEEARRSGWETLRSIFGVLEDRISRMVINYERQIINEANDVGDVEEIKRIYFTLFRRWPIRVLKALLQNVMKPFGPEIRFLLVYILERGSLTYSKASMSEALYGGKRVKLGETNTFDKHERSLRPIGKRDSVRLAFFLAFGPYLEERSIFLFQHFRKLCLSSSYFAGRVSTASYTRRKALQSTLNIVWPLLRATTKGTVLWYRWRYFLGRSVFFDPYSRLLNLVVRRTTMEDHQRTESEPQIKEAGMDGVNPNIIRMATIQKHSLELIRSGRVRRALGGLTSFLIALAWVARIRSIRQELRQERELHDLRQIQHRQQRIDTHQDVNGNRKNILIPSPPRCSLSSRRETKTALNLFGKAADHNSGVCPLCDEPRILPVATTGGHVFCLKCILSFLRQNGGMCPVSKKPCPESSLVRIYEPTSRT